MRQVIYSIDENGCVTVSFLRDNRDDSPAITYNQTDFRQLLDSKAHIEDVIMFLEHGE